MRLLPLRALLGAGMIVVGSMAPAQSLQAPPPQPNSEKLVDAKPGELRVFVTAALQMPMEAVRGKAQPAIKRPLRIEYGSARGNLKKQILAGQAFDVALLLPDVVRELRAQGKLDKRDYPIALIPAAIGLRGDVPSPDVSTPAALAATLLRAQSVKYSQTGAARETVDKIFSTLDIATRIKDTSALREIAPLGPGEYEINLFPVSEVLYNRKLRNLGTVPAPLQVPAQVVAVIAPGADVVGARAFIKFLQGPAIDPDLAAWGMRKAR